MMQSSELKRRLVQGKEVWATVVTHYVNMTIKTFGSTNPGCPFEMWDFVLERKVLKKPNIRVRIDLYVRTVLLFKIIIKR